MSGCGPASEESGYIASWVEPAAEAGAEQSVKGGGFEAAWAAPMMSQGPASKALSPLFRTRNSRGKAGHRGSAGCGWQLSHFCRHTPRLFCGSHGTFRVGAAGPPSRDFFY